MFWSNGYRRLTGRLLEPANAESHYELVHPEDRWMMSELMVADAADEAHLVRIKRADGLERVLQCRLDVLRDSDAQPQTRIVIVRDVSDQQRWVERVRRRQKTLASLAVAAEIAVWRMSEKGELLETQGWAPEKPLSRAMEAHGWLGEVHPSQQETIRDLWLDAFQDHRQFEVTCRLRDASGAYLWRKCRVTPITASDGRVIEWLGVARESSRPAEEALPEDGPTPVQLRGCRGLLGWSIGDLATASSVSAATITRYETAEETGGGMRQRNLVKLRQTLRSHGIEFLAGGAIRLR